MKRRGHKTHDTLDSISHCHCYLICLLADCQGAGYFSCPSSIHNTVVTDEVPDDTQGIMEGSFCFFYDLGRRPCLSSSCWPRGTEPSLQPKDRILTILFPPLMKMVTALEFLHFSITSILSFVVPNEISRTTPAKPSFSEVSSENRGTIRPPVAMAISCQDASERTDRCSQC